MRKPKIRGGNTRNDDIPMCGGYCDRETGCPSGCHCTGGSSGGDWAGTCTSTMGPGHSVYGSDNCPVGMHMMPEGFCMDDSDMPGDSEYVGGSEYSNSTMRRPRRGYHPRKRLRGPNRGR